jgi:precorrin-2 dehydrogenase/sirohydrochlorin ferrochelatase
VSGYPVVLDGDAVRALVVGGGRVGARKIAALLEAGAKVHVLSPTLSGAAETLRDDDGFEWTQAEYSADHIGDANLIFAATDSPALNLAIALDARRMGRLVNVASSGSEGDFATPSVHRDGPLLIAVSAGGVPAAAARIRDFISASLGTGLGDAIVNLLSLRRARIDTGDTAGWKAASQELIGEDFIESVSNGEFDRRAGRWR